MKPELQRQYVYTTERKIDFVIRIFNTAFVFFSLVVFEKIYNKEKIRTIPVL